MTVMKDGRLGNLMSQYATLHFAAKKMGYKAIVDAEMAKSLKKYFPKLPLKTAKDYKWEVLWLSKQARMVILMKHI